MKADETSVENAELKLSFCTIRSPMNGVAGGIKVHRGTIIKANDNDKPIVFINQIRPVNVSFFVPERYLSEIRKQMGAGKLPVSATLEGKRDMTVHGELAFIENAVDANTGSILLKAFFRMKTRCCGPASS